jgi:hypothetical protein
LPPFGRSLAARSSKSIERTGKIIAQIIVFFQPG